MENQFVPYDIALKLKELGFNQPCFRYFNENNESSNFDSNMFDEDKINSKLPDIDDYSYEDKMSDFDFCTVPLYQQVFEFFRSKYNLYHMINPLGYNMCLASVGTFNNLQSCNIPEYGTYRQAEIACINELIELAHDK